jgi:ABC-2 type transport system ATP-binding protein
VIRVRNVSKAYGNHLAVDDISFDVGSPGVVGFLGPNGAGKTTTMRILAGYLVPRSGEVTIAGYDMLRDSRKARRHVGYLPELAPLYLEMTVRAYLRFAAQLKGMDRRQVERRIEEVAPLCGIADHLGSIISKLSKGYRQRVGLAQAIVHDPEVIILDEPTAGIDPIQIVQTKNLIAELGRKRTVLLSSHALPEVSAVCERVVIIQDGKIVASDRIANLLSETVSHVRLRLVVDGPPDAVTAALQEIASVCETRFEAPAHIVTCQDQADAQLKIAAILSAGGWTLTAIETLPATLESVFLEVAAGRRKLQ